MQSLSDDERKAALGEVLADELKVILEYVQEIPSIKRSVTVCQADIAELKTDIKAVKLILTDHGERLVRLELAC